MKIRMLETKDGSPDGLKVNTYEKGTEHDLSGSAGEQDLASVFVREKWAEEVKGKKAAENKATEPAENK